jgi:heat shock protein HslJ
LGLCVTLAWKVNGEVDETAIFRDKEIVWGEAPVEGTYQDCPQTTGTYEYAVGAQGPGGRNYAVGTLQVVEPAAGTKRTPQANVNREPQIDQFAVLPEQLTVGECVELQWTVAGEAPSIRIERSGTTLMDGAPRSGTGTDCPSQPGILRYRIMASDKQGHANSAEVEVSVTAPSLTATPVAAAPAPAPTATPSPQAAGAPAAETPAGQEYVLISYRGAAGDLASPLTGTRITARFGGDRKLSGDGGCNPYSSAYQINGNQLTVSPLAPAEKFCSEPLGIMDQEQQYLSALQTAASYTLAGGLLTLFDGADNQIAVFVPVQ